MGIAFTGRGAYKSGRGLWVGGLPGFLVPVVASALAGSLYLRWGRGGNVAK